MRPTALDGRGDKGLHGLCASPRCGGRALGARLPCAARSCGPGAELVALASLVPLKHPRRVRCGCARVRARATSPPLLGAAKWATHRARTALCRTGVCHRGIDSTVGAGKAVGGRVAGRICGAEQRRALGPRAYSRAFTSGSARVFEWHEHSECNEFRAGAKSSSSAGESGPPGPDRCSQAPTLSRPRPCSRRPSPAAVASVPASATSRIRLSRAPRRCPGRRRCTSCKARSGPGCGAAGSPRSWPAGRRSRRAGDLAQSRRRSD